MDPECVSNDSNISAIPTTVIPTYTPTVSLTPSPADIGEYFSNQYLESKYKVIATLHNESGLYDLVIITTRENYTDETCGSIYTPICYFIRQRRSNANAVLPDKYLGEWQSHSLDSLILSSLNFVDQDTVEFGSYGEDDGNESSSTVQIDLISGEIRELGIE